MYLDQGAKEGGSCDMFGVFNSKLQSLFILSSASFVTPNISPPLSGRWNSHLRHQEGAEGPQGAAATLLETLLPEDRGLALRVRA